MTQEEKIRQVAQKYIATDKHNGVGVRTQAFIDGAEWADKHPASPWQSVADGNIPKVDIDCLFAYEGVIDKGYMREDRSLSLDSEFAPLLDIDDVDYWMEIPKLPK